MPQRDRQLGGDDGGALIGAVLDDLEGVGGLFGAEGPEEQVIDHQDADAGPARHHPRDAAVGPRDGEVVEHAGSAQVERGVALADRRVGQRAGEVGLAHAGRADDH